MPLSQALERALTSVPGCHTAIYVDASSGLVLGSAAIRRRPQEVMDRIAATAASLFQSSGLLRAATALAENGDGDVRHFIVYRPSVTQFFVQAENDPEHVLCYLCQPSADPDMVFAEIMKNRHHVAIVF